jgi:HEPN domain-containing protein
MEKKQTAVEFYRTEFSALLSMKESKFQTENEIFEKAKQMEKEQIKNSYLDGDSNGCGCYDWSTEEQAEDYYKETYKEIK